MLKNILFFLLVILGVQQYCIAQDANLEAKVFYAKAEENYNNGNYVDALRNLSAVEDLLGATNSKVLYMKANVYNALMAKDWSYSTQLKGTLQQFFDITDQSKYPQDKYLDMVTLNLDLKTKIEQYESEYAAVRNSSNKAQIKGYINKFPNSAHAMKSSPKSKQLEAREKEIERTRSIDAIASKHRPIIKKRLTKGIVCLIVGKCRLFTSRSSYGCICLVMASLQNTVGMLLHYMW
jgi:outer membrane protein assembly factor BamD (BamD/ComL family)